MAKGFAIFGLLVAIVFLLVFAMDLAMAIPFGKVSLVADILFVLASLALGYMSFMTYRENR